jgi:hypothetical protein
VFASVTSVFKRALFSLCYVLSAKTRTQEQAARAHLLQDRVLLHKLTDAHFKLDPRARLIIKLLQLVDGRVVARRLGPTLAIALRVRHTNGKPSHRADHAISRTCTLRTKASCRCSNACPTSAPEKTVISTKSHRSVRT